MAKPSEVIFTSGGTESVNTAIRCLAQWRKRPLLITSAVEHAAVREQLEVLGRSGDQEVIVLPNDTSGIVSVEALESLIASRGEDIALVTVMWANNETGVIQPIEQLGTCCRAAGIPFHSDATQWVGKMPVDLSVTPVDMISCAGHKFHGPKGVGVLWVREGLPVFPLILGGGQERGRRGGTESVADIVGLGVASRVARAWLESGGHEAMPQVRADFEAAIRARVPDCCVNAEAAPRMWSTSNVGFPRVEAELMLLGLSEAGVYASAGSACSSGALKESSVLDALGRQPCQTLDQSYGSVRFSFDREVDPADLARAVGIVGQVLERLQQLVPGSNWPNSARQTTA
jgi:cysteine desulfurase